MSTKDKLDGKARLEKHKIKSEDLALTNVSSFTKSGVQYTILDKTEINGVLEMNVTARRGNSDIEIDNPLRFVNPPIMVPDGTTRTETNSFGEDVTVPNFVEDLEKVIEEIVVEAIRVTGKE